MTRGDKMINLLEIKTNLEKRIISIFNLGSLRSQKTLQDVENTIFQWDPEFQIPAYIRRTHIKNTSMPMDHPSEGV